MKKTIILSLLLMMALTTYSCKETEKKDTASDQSTDKTTKVESIKSEKTYSIIPETVSIKWTAYKTTEKKPVKGSFTSSNISGVHSANSIQTALGGLKFSIPTNSIFSDNNERDQKLKKSFFGKMIDMDNITGRISYEKDGLYANITMNGISYKQILDFEVKGDVVNVAANIDLKNWKSQVAIKALNVVCGELHKGKDGISKTWDEVLFNASVQMKIENKK